MTEAEGELYSVLYCSSLHTGLHSGTSLPMQLKWLKFLYLSFEETALYCAGGTSKTMNVLAWVSDLCEKRNKGRIMSCFIAKLEVL